MKENKTNCGIYKITNLTPNEITYINKVYIGSSANIKSRKSQHLNELRKNKHKNKHLQNAFIRDGEENFKFEVVIYIEKIEDKKLLKEELLKWENLEINKYKKQDGTIDHDKCYNFLATAGSNLGYRHSKETKEKISRAHKGCIVTKETKEKISNSSKGHIMLEKTKEDISKALKGKKLSEVTKNKISRSNSGKKRSKESKRKYAGLQEKSVINLDNGNVFKSIKEASIYYNLKSSSRIGEVCKGKGNTSGGCKWAYFNNTDKGM
jgi:group I intron endonuclease